MAKARSPQYPVIGLKEAVERVRGVYDNDYQNAIPRALVATHMGYQSLNGKSLGVLAALTRYGLLEGRGDDTRVTDLAVTIIAHEPGDPERVAAVTEAAGKPELFKELAGRFPGRASDQALRSYLITQKFIPPAALAAIRAYRETMAMVETEQSLAPDDVDDYDAPVSEIIRTAPSPASPVPIAPAAVTATPMSMLPDGDPYRVSYSPTAGLEVIAKLKTMKDVDALIAAVNAWKVLFRPIESILPPKDEEEAI